MDMLSTAAGADVLNMNGQDWPAKGASESYEDYYKGLAGGISAGTFGSYDIQ